MYSNYVTANRFYVDIENGAVSASFSECSSFGVKLEYEPVKQGGVNDRLSFVLGQPKFTEVTLKRGVTDNALFWEWLNDAMREKFQRRDAYISLFNQAGECMQCWRLIGAIPIGWSAPALQADAKTVAIEELTLMYEGIELERLPAPKEVNERVYDPARASWVQLQQARGKRLQAETELVKATEDEVRIEDEVQLAEGEGRRDEPMVGNYFKK